MAKYAFRKFRDVAAKVIYFAKAICLANLPYCYYYATVVSIGITVSMITIRLLFFFLFLSTILVTSTSTRCCCSFCSCYYYCSYCYPCYCYWYYRHHQLQLFAIPATLNLIRPAADGYYLPPLLRPTYDYYRSGSGYVQCLVAPSILSASNDKPQN